MEITEVIGFIAALIIGIVLGLIGGGGSILTVPVLVYILHIHPITATAYSLFVVGVSSTAGAIQNLKKGLIDFQTALIFAIPSLLTVYGTRRYIVPAIPNQLISYKNIIITKEIGLMIFFAFIMFIASISMIRNDKRKTKSLVKSNTSYTLIFIEGIVVGILTGLVGAGGGFLIIPALVLMAKLPMKKAVATSLLIIAIKSLIGFLGDVENLEIEWHFLLPFTLVAVLGIFLGTYFTRYIEGKKLEKGFGWFVLLMSLYILLKEVA